MKTLILQEQKELFIRFRVMYINYLEMCEMAGSLLKGTLLKSTANPERHLYSSLSLILTRDQMWEINENNWFVDDVKGYEDFLATNFSGE